MSINNWFIRQRAFIEIWSTREVWRARKMRKSCSRLTTSLGLYSTRTTESICQVKLPLVSHFIRHAQKTHMLRGIDFKSRTLFGTHIKCSEISHVMWEWLVALYSVRSENAHVSRGWLQVSISIRHAQKTHMLIKIDLKSRTLFGLYSDRRFVNFLSYFKTLSHWEEWISVSHWIRHGDITLSFNNLLLF